MTTNQENEWLAPKALAVEVGVPVATVYDWRYNGKGPRAYRFGRHIRFRRSDVEAWIESCAVARP